MTADDADEKKTLPSAGRRLVAVGDDNADEKKV